MSKKLLSTILLLTFLFAPISIRAQENPSFLKIEPTYSELIREKAIKEERKSYEKPSKRDDRRYLQKLRNHYEGERTGEFEIDEREIDEINKSAKKMTKESLEDLEEEFFKREGIEFPEWKLRNSSNYEDKKDFEKWDFDAGAKIGTYHGIPWPKVYGEMSTPLDLEFEIYAQPDDAGIEMKRKFKFGERINFGVGAGASLEDGVEIKSSFNFRF